MKISRNGTAKWQGGLAGRGAVGLQSGALQQHPYGFGSRFEGVKGTNPEELLGAAHAACFTMAFAKGLQDAGFVAESIETAATVTLEAVAGGFAIAGVQLATAARVSGIDDPTFQHIAAAAKAGCPVSKALRVDIAFEARLQLGNGATQA